MCSALFVRVLPLCSGSASWPDRLGPCRRAGASRPADFSVPRSNAVAVSRCVLFCSVFTFGAFVASFRVLASIVAHIHEKIDFTVCVFVVQDSKVLLIHHRKLDKWLPLGGHVELDEDPEQAALREAKEESGLEVELLGERPPTTGPGTRALIAPRFLDIHRINDSHEH